MSRVHVAPSATANGTLEVYGAPPLSVVSSEQLRLQPTSLGYDPSEQVIAEEMVELEARNNGSHCRGQATPSGLDGYNCDVTSLSSETGITTARCSNRWCSPEVRGCVRPVPIVVAPVPKTAAAPRRMRMQCTARSVAWWLKWEIQWAPHVLAHGRRERGGGARECVVPEEGD